MKKSLLLLVVVAATTFTGFAQKLKLGHVNTQQIMESLYVTDSVQMKFEKYQRALQSELQRIQTDLRNDEQQLILAKDTLPEEIFRQRAERLQMEQQEFQQQTYPQMQQSLQNKQQALLLPIQDKIDAAIEKVAKEHGFTYIFELEATPFAGGTDVTKLVRVALGLPEVPVQNSNGQGMPLGR